MEKSLDQQIREELHNVINKPSEEYIQKVANAIINKDYKTLLETTTTQLQKTPADINAYKQTFNTIDITLKNSTKEEQQKILEKANQYIQMGKILLPENNKYFEKIEEETKKIEDILNGKPHFTKEEFTISKNNITIYRDIKFLITEFKPEYKEFEYSGFSYGNGEIKILMDKYRTTQKLESTLILENTNQKLRYTDKQTNWKRMYLHFNKIQSKSGRFTHNEGHTVYSVDPHAVSITAEIEEK